MRSLASLVLVASQILAQQTAGISPAGTDNAAGKPSPSVTLRHIQASDKTPSAEAAQISIRRSLLDFLAPYRKPTASPLPLNTAERARSLVRNNTIYLSLYDAIALAIENNLDVEVSRYDLSIAGTDLLRARGGGNLRGLDLSIAESPTGVGGPGSPLLNSAASTVTPTAPTINDLTSLNELTQTQTNLSVASVAPYAPGPNIPAFDPSFVGQNTWFHRGNTGLLTTQTLGESNPLAQAPTVNFTTANYALVQGFSTGTQLEIDLNNAAQVLYGTSGNYDPFSSPNTSVTLTQPLLRGWGRDVNLRFIRIAAINQSISRLAFYQQLISTVYGVARLYYDLVSLNENAQVKRESLAAARKLYEDDASQVEQGTLAPLELTRAQSLVTSSQLDLIQAEGLVHQQEVILKSQLARHGSADPILANLPIVPTEPIRIPDSDNLQTADAIVGHALSMRPDLIQASLQVEGGELAVKASQNAARPQVDLIGNFQTRGSAEVPFTVLGTQGTGLINAPASLNAAGLRTSRIYQAGIQMNLPLRNRVATADAARDLLQLRQAEARTQRLSNEVRVQVENSIIALQTARSALQAAIQSRQYQEQLLSAERDKLSVGASTNLLVIQQQSYLAQARSTEVAARSVWIKAKVALDRSTGDLLEQNGITYDDSVVGKLPDTAPQPADVHK